MERKHIFLYNVNIQIPNDSFLDLPNQILKVGILHDLYLIVRLLFLNVGTVDCSIEPLTDHVRLLSHLNPEIVNNSHLLWEKGAFQRYFINKLMFDY